MSKPGTRTNRELHDRAAAMLRAMNADRPARRRNPHRNTGPAAAKTMAEALLRGLQKELEFAKREAPRRQTPPTNTDGGPVSARPWGKDADRCKGHGNPEIDAGANL